MTDAELITGLQFQLDHRELFTMSVKTRAFIHTCIDWHNNGGTLSRGRVDALTEIFKEK